VESPGSSFPCRWGGDPPPASLLCRPKLRWASWHRVPRHLTWQMPWQSVPCSRPLVASTLPPQSVLCDALGICHGSDHGRCRPLGIFQLTEACAGCIPRSTGRERITAFGNGSKSIWHSHRQVAAVGLGDPFPVAVMPPWRQSCFDALVRSPRLAPGCRVRAVIDLDRSTGSAVSNHCSDTCRSFAAPE
jgi:hypothetical protein